MVNDRERSTLSAISFQEIVSSSSSSPPSSSSPSSSSLVRGGGGGRGRREWRGGTSLETPESFDESNKGQFLNHVNENRTRNVFRETLMSPNQPSPIPPLESFKCIFICSYNYPVHFHLLI